VLHAEGKLFFGDAERDQLLNIRVRIVAFADTIRPVGSLTSGTCCQFPFRGGCGAADFAHARLAFKAMHHPLAVIEFYKPFEVVCRSRST
jgi:hypothetical protein